MIYVVVSGYGEDFRVESAWSTEALADIEVSRLQTVAASIGIIFPQPDSLRVCEVALDQGES